MARRCTGPRGGDVEMFASDLQPHGWGCVRKQVSRVKPRFWCTARRGLPWLAWKAGDTGQGRRWRGLAKAEAPLRSQCGSAAALGGLPCW